MFLYVLVVFRLRFPAGNKQASGLQKGFVILLSGVVESRVGAQTSLDLALVCSHLERAVVCLGVLSQDEVIEVALAAVVVVAVEVARFISPTRFYLYFMNLEG